ncbi:DNA gyrase inhibitor GyrI [Oxalobacteraceae bacterium GrIS 1.11]
MENLKRSIHAGFPALLQSTPSAWRAQTPARWAEQARAARARTAAQRNLDQAERNPDQAGGAPFEHHDISATHMMENEMIKNQLNLRFAHLPSTRVAYLRKIGPYGTPVGQFVNEVFLPWLRANGLGGRPWYGMSHDDPSITPPDKCRFDACVGVPDDFTPTGLAMLTTLAGGRYAIARFEGSSATIGDAWTALLRDWLPDSGMQCDARPVFEYYAEESRFDPQTGRFDCELCLPVCPL